MGVRAGRLREGGGGAPIASFRFDTGGVTPTPAPPPSRGRGALFGRRHEEAALTPPLIRFPDLAALADRLAADLADALAAALAQRSRASLVVPGGSTPGALFDRLCGAELAWERVDVTLTDERWLDPSDPASNEHLIRTRLLTANAACASFTGLKTPDPTPEAGTKVVEARLAGIGRPFDVVVLGMGADGHTASLFPGSPAMRASLEGDPAMVQAVTAPGAGGAAERMTLALPALLDSRFTTLMITGAEKLETLARAQSGDDALELPIRAFLNAPRPPRIYWAPLR